jgi:hypothetical protein
VPKPTKVTFSSLTSESVIAEIIPSTASLDVLLVSPVWLAISSTNSVLFVLGSFRLIILEELTLIVAKHKTLSKKPCWRAGSEGRSPLL